MSICSTPYVLTHANTNHRTCKFVLSFVLTEQTSAGRQRLCAEGKQASEVTETEAAKYSFAAQNKCTRLENQIRLAKNLFHSLTICNRKFQGSKLCSQIRKEMSSYVAFMVLCCNWSTQVALLKRLYFHANQTSQL